MSEPKYLFPRVAELTPAQLRKALDDIAACLWVESRGVWGLPDDFWYAPDREVNGPDYIDAVTGILGEVGIKPPAEEKSIGHELP